MIIVDRIGVRIVFFFISLPEGDFGNRLDSFKDCLESIPNNLTDYRKIPSNRSGINFVELRQSTDPVNSRG